jgi:DNA-binding transcriptional regulator GbsR (MarR family)
MAGQGNPMHEGQIRTVISLLASTEMSIPEIAQRMGCSRSAIAAVNRKFQVRQYHGRRSTWEVSVHEAPNTEEKRTQA